MGYETPDIHIYSNDGSTLLYHANDYAVDSGGVLIPPTVTEKGLVFDKTLITTDYIYTGKAKFIGFATSPNATEPTYAIGDTTLTNGSLYIVESVENTTWYVPSGWSVTGKINCEINGVLKYLANNTSYNFNELYFGFNTVDGDADMYALSVHYYNPNTNSYSWTLYKSDELVLEFTSGVDIANSNLISWLTTYGIQLKVEDLTDTTWNVKAGWEAEAGYGRFNVYYSITSDALPSVTVGEEIVFSIGYSDYDNSATANTICSRPEIGPSLADVALTSSDTFTLTITDGTDATDATNPKLIAWLSKWGELRLTDLKGTTWEYTVQSVVPNGTMTHTDGYSVSGTINSTPFSGIASQVVDRSNNLDDGLNFESVTLFPNGVVPLGTVGNVYHIKFTAGDTTNTSLISWMYDNCTLVSINEEEEPDTPTTPHGEIYYKGNLVATLVEGETIVLHTKDFKFLGDIVIRNVRGGIISFTIDGVEYKAEEGMTWAEWVANTTYNTVGAYADVNNALIRVPFSGINLAVKDDEGIFVYNYKKIIANTAYGLEAVGGDSN